MLRASALLLLALAAAARGDDPAKDVYGDPLPPGAVARLGTERFRNLDPYTRPQLTPDGTTLLGMTREGYMRFDVATGLPSGKMPGEPGGSPLTAAELSADGTTAVRLRYDGLDVWDVKTGKKLLEVKASTQFGPAAVSLSADGKLLAVSGQADEKAKAKGVPASVWDVAAKKEITSVKVAQNVRSAVALSGDGKTLVTWGNHAEPNQAYDKYDPATDPNRLVQVWDAATGKERAGLRVNGAITAVAVSPDGTAVAASPGNGEIQVWDGTTGKPRYTLAARSRMGKTLAFSPDGKTLAASAEDAAIQLFDVAAGKSKGVTPCPVVSEFLSVAALRFTAPDRAVAVLKDATATTVWEVPSGKRLSPAGGHVDRVVSVTFAAGGQEVFTSPTTGAPLRWDRAGKPLGTVEFTVPGWGDPKLRISDVTFLPGGKVATGAVGSEVAVFDLPAAAERCALAGENTYSKRLHFDAARATAVMLLPPPYAKDNPKPWRAVTYDVAAGRKLDPVPLPSGDVSTSGLSPDGKTLVVVRKVVGERPQPEYVLNTLDAATGTAKADVPVKTGYGSGHVTFAPDGKTFLLLNGDGGKTVYDTATLKVARELKDEARGNPPIPALFSPDGKMLAMAYGGDYGGPPTILVYEWASGTIARTFRGHSRPITCLAFSDDGKRLATGSFDTTVLLWDLTKETVE